MRFLWASEGSILIFFFVHPKHHFNNLKIVQFTTSFIFIVLAPCNN